MNFMKHNKRDCVKILPAALAACDLADTPDLKIYPMHYAMMLMKEDMPAEEQLRTIHSMMDLTAALMVDLHDKQAALCDEDDDAWDDDEWADDDEWDDDDWDDDEWTDDEWEDRGKWDTDVWLEHPVDGSMEITCGGKTLLHFSADVLEGLKCHGVDLDMLEQTLLEVFDCDN